MFLQIDRSQVRDVIGTGKDEYYVPLGKVESGVVLQVLDRKGERGSRTGVAKDRVVWKKILEYTTKVSNHTVSKYKYAGLFIILRGNIFKAAGRWSRMGFCDGYRNES